jgi:hypothetical protein
MEETKTIQAKVGLFNLMAQAAQEMKCFGVSVGFQIAQKRLQRIAQRAIEINDPVILEELNNLCVITMGEEEVKK